jgi:hypothetical protein
LLSRRALGPGGKANAARQRAKQRLRSEVPAHLSRQEAGRSAALRIGTNDFTEATMSAIDPTSEHFVYAEKLRRLRQQLTETIDHLQREEILRQIEEIEEGLKNKYKQ